MQPHDSRWEIDTKVRVLAHLSTLLNVCFRCSYWTRFIIDGSLGSQKRFVHTMDLFFKAITIQARDRAAGSIPDLEDYIVVRRDTSGCKPCWALIEYASGLDLPDEVMEHPIIQNLNEATNDLVTWSNVRTRQDYSLPLILTNVFRTSSLTIANRPKVIHTT